MGGRAMMYVALKYPQLVEKAIFVDVSPIDVPHLSGLKDILYAMHQVKLDSSLSLADGRVEAGNQMLPSLETQELVDLMVVNLRKRTSGEFHWAVNVETLLKTYRHFDEFGQEIQGLPPFKGPVLFICGKESDFFNPADWDQILEIFPNSRLKWLDAGHLVHLDQPQGFTELVTNFMEQ